MFLGSLHFTQEHNKNPPRFANMTRKLYSKQSSRNEQNTLAEGNGPQTGTQESQPLFGLPTVRCKKRRRRWQRRDREGVALVSVVRLGHVVPFLSLMSLPITPVALIIRMPTYE